MAKMRGNSRRRDASKNMPQLPVKWFRLAEARCAQAAERLTPARLAAYAELVASERPLSAYELIALLEKRQQRDRKSVV